MLKKVLIGCCLLLLPTISLAQAWYDVPYWTSRPYSKMSVMIGTLAVAGGEAEKLTFTNAAGDSLECRAIGLTVGSLNDGAAAPFGQLRFYNNGTQTGFGLHSQDADGQSKLRRIAPCFGETNYYFLTFPTGGPNSMAVANDALAGADSIIVGYVAYVYE